MHSSPHHRNRPSSRLTFAYALWAVALLAGCTLISVDESRWGRPVHLRFSGDHAPFRAREIIFSHEVHATEPCETCHFGTTSADTYAEERTLREDNDELEDVALPSMALCFQCHDHDGAPHDCITCHVENRRGRKPQFHDGLWPRHHKHMAEREAFKCSLCHVENECRDCHSTRKPLSHTQRFERSTHGRMATHDRQSCATCHEVSFCENCHSQPPPDHTPIFMGGGGHRQAALIRGRSCLVCHSFEDACSECHNR